MDENGKPRTPTDPHRQQLQVGRKPFERASGQSPRAGENVTNDEPGLSAATTLNLKQAPPPPELPAGLNNEEEQEFLRRENTAYNLDKKTTAAYLASAFGGKVDIESCQVYLRNLLESAGVGDDPLEKLLVEQVFLAHHQIGRLYIAAAAAEHLQQANAYHAAAARLVAEVRRMILTLKEYRMPALAKGTDGRQTVAAAG